MALSKGISKEEYVEKQEIKHENDFKYETNQKCPVGTYVSTENFTIS